MPVKMKFMPASVPTAHSAVLGKPSHKSTPTTTPAIPLAISRGRGDPGSLSQRTSTLYVKHSGRRYTLL
jgi:hypothetical protein